MNTHTANEAPTVEEGVNALLEDARESMRQQYKHYEECVRESPGKAILAAMAAGYILHRLPVRSLLVSQVRLLAALAPPALLAFGSARLCEFLQRQARDNRRGSASAPAEPPTASAVTI